MELQIHQFLSENQSKTSLTRGDIFNVTAVLTGYRQACMLTHQSNFTQVCRKIEACIDSFRLKSEVGWHLYSTEEKEPLWMLVYCKQLVDSTSLSKYLELVTDRNTSQSHCSWSHLIGVILGYQSPNDHLPSSKGRGPSYLIHYYVANDTPGNLEAQAITGGSTFHSEIINSLNGHLSPVYTFNLERQLSEYNHLAHQLGLTVRMSQQLICRGEQLSQLIRSQDAKDWYQVRHELANYFWNYSFAQTAEALQQLTEDSVHTFINTYGDSLVLLAEWIQQDPVRCFYPLNKTEQGIVRVCTDRLENYLYRNPKKERDSSFPVMIQRFTKSLIQSLESSTGKI